MGDTAERVGTDRQRRCRGLRLAGDDRHRGADVGGADLELDGARAGGLTVAVSVTGVPDSWGLAGDAVKVVVVGVGLVTV